MPKLATMIAKDLKRFFSELTDFIPSERKWIAFLIFLACVLNLSFFVATYKIDTTPILFKTVEAKEYSYKSYGESVAADQEEKENRVTDRFQFNPNTVSYDELIRLGFSEKVAHVFLNYRNKGGRFFKKEDVQKIYGISDKLYLSIAPYISIERQSNSDNNKKYPKQEEVVSLDINAASPMDYEKLKGIGKGYANRICNFRDKLGGFVTIDQVGETFGLPDSVFQSIKPMLQIHSPSPKKININTATLDAMDSHPYIARWQAEDILNNRPIKDIDQLFKLKSFKKKEYNQRVIPYLTF